MAGPPAALTFTRKYGPLRLDARGYPVGATLGPRHELPFEHRYEPVGRLVFYSKVAGAVLEAARALQRDEPIPSAAWGPLLDVWDEIDAYLLQPWLADLIGPRIGWKRPLPDEPLVKLPPSPVQTWMVSNTVNWWIHTSWLAPHLGWTRSGSVSAVVGWKETRFSDTMGKIRKVRSEVRSGPVWGIEIEGGARERLSFVLGGGGAWGALGVRLAEAVMGLPQDKEERCAYRAAGCLGWFAVNRACPSNRRPCCGQPACRTAAATWRQRQRRARMQGETR
ncbi:MAG: hypothetical protein ACREOQ_14625 [Gemmatimonadales bacterium]